MIPSAERKTLAGELVSNEIKNYLYDYIKNWEKGTVVDDYNVQMLGFLFLEFPDQITRDRIANEFKKHVNIVYKDHVKGGCIK